VSRSGDQLVTRGALRVFPLDALDPSAFRAAVAELPGGPIAVVEEGLLMYLDDAEKIRLAANVREALSTRGGAWVTADIYVRSETRVFREERTRRFLEAHGVEEKKFAHFEAAADFFAANGFTVASRLSPPADPWPMRQTWILSAGAGAL
jgi:O-methyltransferase involved in polyketide biosynthesis